MNQSTLTRKELYDLLWSEPKTAIQKKYGVSHHDLRELLIKFNIPAPAMGHWEKLQFNKPVHIEPLPAWEGEEPVITLSPEIHGELSTDNLFSLEKKLRNELVNDKEINLIVPDRLTKPDPLIQAALKNLSEKGFKKKYNTDIRYSGFGNIDIRVSPENIRRSVLFMDTFIKLIKSRGHTISISYTESHVIISEQKIKITFREKTSRVELNDKYNRFEYQPNDLLCLKMGGHTPKEWVDGKLKLEHQLPQILARFELEGLRLKKYHEEIHQYWEEHRKKEQIKKDLLKRKENELSDFKKLLVQSERWHKSVVLQNFISEMETRSKLNQTNPEELKNWLVWAREKADWYNPFIESEDELLCDTDRNSINLMQV